MARQPKPEIDDFNGAPTEAPPAKEAIVRKAINLTLLSGGRPVMAPIDVVHYDYKDGVLSCILDGGNRIVTNVEFLAVED